VVRSCPLIAYYELILMKIVMNVEKFEDNFLWHFNIATVNNTNMAAI
jgi:hypothetical protein